MQAFFEAAGNEQAELPVLDIFGTSNHFVAFDYLLDTADKQLLEAVRELPKCDELSKMPVIWVNATAENVERMLARWVVSETAWKYPGYVRMVRNIVRPAAAKIMFGAQAARSGNNMP